MISKNEQIVTAFADYASGPGWSNMPIWVIVRTSDQELREICIQPQDQTPEMHTLFHISHAAHEAMKSAVEKVLANASQKKEF